MQVISPDGYLDPTTDRPTAPWFERSPGGRRPFLPDTALLILSDPISSLQAFGPPDVGITRHCVDHRRLGLPCGPPPLHVVFGCTLWNHAVESHLFVEESNMCI